MNALVSYNKIRVPKKIQKHVACFDNIFNPKDPSSVLLSDMVYQKLLHNQHQYKRIIVFLGKKSSGSCKMIPLLWNSIEKEKLFFILCHHDIEEKISILHENSVPKLQYLSFCDNWHQEGKPCNEVPIMIGIALQKAD